MKLLEAIEKTDKVVYEFISVPEKLVKKYSKYAFRKKPINFHITTEYMPKKVHKENYGENISYKVIAYGTSGVAEAVKIELVEKPKWLKPKDNLHITLSFANKPVDSNYITDWKPVNDETIYNGKFFGYIN